MAYLRNQLRQDRAGEGQREAMCGPLLTTAPADEIVVKGWGAASWADQTTESATGIEPGWLRQTEFGPKDRNREMVLKKKKKLQYS